MMSADQVSYGAWNQLRAQLGKISYPIFLEQYWHTGMKKSFAAQHEKLLSNPYPEVDTVEKKLRLFYENRIGEAVVAISGLLRNKTAAKRDSLMLDDDTIAANVNLACENDSRYGSSNSVLAALGVQTPLQFQQSVVTQITQSMGEAWPEFHRKYQKDYDSEKFIRYFKKHLNETAMPEVQLLSGRSLREQSHKTSVELMQSATPKIDAVIRVSENSAPLQSLRTDRTLAHQNAPGLVPLNKAPGLVEVAGEAPLVGLSVMDLITPAQKKRWTANGRHHDVLRLGNRKGKPGQYYLVLTDDGRLTVHTEVPLQIFPVRAYQGPTGGKFMIDREHSTGYPKGKLYVNELTPKTLESLVGSQPTERWFDESDQKEHSSIRSDISDCVEPCTEPVGHEVPVEAERGPGLIPLASVSQDSGFVGSRLSERVGKASYDRWMTNANHYEHLKNHHNNSNYFLHFKTGERLFLHHSGRDVVVDPQPGKFYVHNIAPHRDMEKNPRQKGELLSGTGTLVRGLTSDDLIPVLGHRNEIYWNEPTNRVATIGDTISSPLKDSGPGLIPLSEVARQLSAEQSSVDGPIDWLREKKAAHKAKKEEKRKAKEERERVKKEEGERHLRTKGEVGIPNPLEWLDDEAETLRRAHEKAHEERFQRHERRRRERGHTNEPVQALVKGEQFDIGRHKPSHKSSSSSSSPSDSDDVQTDEALGGSGEFSSTSSSSMSGSDSDSERRPRRTGNQPPSLIAPDEIGKVAPNHNLQKLTTEHPLYQKLLQSQRVQSPSPTAPSVATATLYLKQYLAVEGKNLTDKNLLYLAPIDSRLNPVKHALEKHVDPRKVTQFTAAHLFYDAAAGDAVHGRSFKPVASFGQNISIDKSKMIQYQTGQTVCLAEPSFYYDEATGVFVRIVPQGAIIPPRQ